MQGKLQKMFIGDDTLRWSAFIAIICYIVAIVDSIASKSIQDTLYFVFAVILIICVISSFYKHEKKAMRNMVTALLTWNIMYEISAVSYFFSSTKIFQAVTVEATDNSLRSAMAANHVGMAFEIVSLILLLVVFINHFVTSNDSKPLTKKVGANQVILTILIFVWIGFIITLFVMGFEYGLTFMGLGMILNFVLIISIETKIDSYKRIREENEAKGTWNEETKAAAKKEVFGE